MKYPLCFNFLVGEKRVAPLVSAKGVSLFVMPLSFRVRRSFEEGGVEFIPAKSGRGVGVQLRAE
jgi:hypothetical protein